MLKWIPGASHEGPQRKWFGGSFLEGERWFFCWGVTQNAGNEVWVLQMQQENELQAGQQIWWLPWDIWPLGCQCGKCHTRSEPFNIPSLCALVNNWHFRMRSGEFWWIKGAKWGPSALFWDWFYFYSGASSRAGSWIASWEQAAASTECHLSAVTALYLWK